MTRRRKKKSDAGGAVISRVYACPLAIAFKFKSDQMMRLGQSLQFMMLNVMVDIPIYLPLAFEKGNVQNLIKNGSPQ